GAIEKLADVVREELNVRRIRFVAAADELGSYEVKANYRSLGPLFGKDMPLVADAIAALDPARVAAAVRGGREIGIAVNGHEHTLSASDLIVTIRAPEGYSVEREGGHAVALDLAIDEDRKSTRLNSSHVSISYAVFCLKKKNKKQIYKQDVLKNTYDFNPAFS